MEHKFKIGDKVEVIKGGCGCPLDNIEKLVKITDLGEYTDRGRGYIVSPAIGNSKTGTYDGFIGEESFKLVKPNWIENGKPNWKRKYE